MAFRRQLLLVSCFLCLFLGFLFVPCTCSDAATDSQVLKAAREVQPIGKAAGETQILGMGALTKGVAERSHVPASTVGILTLLMAVATGLGGIPFFFFSLDPAWQGICNGIACGVMLAASFDLIVEGQAHGGGECVVAGLLLGGLFILVSQKVLESFGDVKVMDVKGVDARRMILIVGIMTLHSFGEGSGVGVSFAGPNGFSQGLLVTIAIAVHNIPEGLAVSMVMASRGMSAHSAMLWAVFTSLPQPLVAVPAFLFAEVFNHFLPLCVGFAAGCMIWMVFGEVMPESLKDSNASHVASAATISVAVMEGVGTLLQGVNELPRWEAIGPVVYSFLFVVGPFLGGLLIVLLRAISSLHPALLSGLSAGVMLVLAIWRPIHLWVGGKMGFFSIIALLYAGAFIYLGLIRLARIRTSQSSDSVLKVEKGGGSYPINPVGRAALYACGAVVCHALAEGLMLGVAAPHAEGLGMYMLLPVALHGLPRGIAAACTMLSASKSSGSALLAAAVTGLAGPVGAWGAMLGGLDYRGLDYWMVLACGALVPAALSELLPRAMKLNRRQTYSGLALGFLFVLSALSATRLLCLNTAFCNSAPEAVT
eukprot:TRINITY_DN35792_c0_g1_i1.p1 TRINITY_DN35792_c0_g1~~TRINITY_DN35792_c0_g1_i1.p1  ORF type:complete len:595 (+),score=67.66 TRINITY_DN35792_c0_g1_i1:304-2088(+)